MLPAALIHTKIGQRNGFCSSALALFTVIIRSAYGSEPALAGHHHIVGPAGAVDDLHIPAGIKSAHDPHVAVAGIEYQITGGNIAPRDICTVAVLRGCPAAVAYDCI